MVTASDVVTGPGVYDLPADVYHADPVPGGSLSSSGAKLLLPPSCPALFRYSLDHPRPPKDTYDFGHAAHRLVLGAGADMVEVKHDDWRTKAAKEAKAAAHAEGKTPILTKDLEHAKAMAEAVRRDPVAGPLFDPERGDPERTLVWRDDATGVWRRAMLDFLPNRGYGRVIVPDYKTCDSADPESIQRAAYNYRYYRQSAWYLDGVRALDLDDEPVFVLVFQERTPPYLINWVQPDPPALALGREENREALEVYRDCRAADMWPGYASEIEYVSLPPWVQRQHEGVVIW